VVAEGLEGLVAAIVRPVVEAAARGETVELPDRRLVVPEPGELRGIPVVGAGVGGVIRGTHPEHETMRRAGRERP
jgi:hypothetical protein